MPLLDQANKPISKRYFFSDFRQWSHITELLLASNTFAVILAIASVSALDQLSWSSVFHHMLFSTWVTICFVVFIDLLQRYLIKIQRNLSLVLCFGLLLFLVCINTYLINILKYYSEFQRSALTWQIISEDSLKHLLLGGGVGLIGLRYLYVREQWLEQQRSELVAKVQALQARIHPHFLFNSLNSVVSLIGSDPFKAEQMLIDLSSLFRASLTELKEVSLEEEIQLCQHYLKIEQVRLGDRLTVKWRIDSVKKLKLAKIPLLTLQPLLENSVYHGVETLSNPSIVSILIEVVEQQVNVVLTNAYEDREKLSRQGNGIAMDNVKQRLIAHYGSTVTFNVFRQGGTCTTLLSYKYQ